MFFNLFICTSIDTLNWTTGQQQEIYMNSISIQVLMEKSFRVSFEKIRTKYQLFRKTTFSGQMTFNLSLTLGSLQKSVPFFMFGCSYIHKLGLLILIMGIGLLMPFPIHLLIFLTLPGVSAITGLSSQRT